MKEPINLGALDPQQRLDVARGQPAPSVAGSSETREPTFAMVQAACAAFRMDVSPMQAMHDALSATGALILTPEPASTQVTAKNGLARCWN